MYFARISNQLNASNQLQTYLLSELKRYHCILVVDPNELVTAIEKICLHANVVYKRCIPQKVGAQRDFKTKQIHYISIGGLFQLSIHEVAGRFVWDENPYKQILPLEMPEPTPTPKPAPNLEDDSRFPKAAIFVSRESRQIANLKPYTIFPVEIRVILQEGRVWATYYNDSNNIVVEEYGGLTHIL